MGVHGHPLWFIFPLLTLYDDAGVQRGVYQDAQDRFDNAGHDLRALCEEAQQKGTACREARCCLF